MRSFAKVMSEVFLEAELRACLGAGGAIGSWGGFREYRNAGFLGQDRKVFCILDYISSAKKKSLRRMLEIKNRKSFNYRSLRTFDIGENTELVVCAQ
jgi:hypothetical protein